MRTVFDFIARNAGAVLVPLAVFLVSVIALFWLRKLAFDWSERRLKKAGWVRIQETTLALKAPTALFCLILSIYLGLEASEITPAMKELSGRVLWTLFFVAIAIMLLSLSSRLVRVYGRRFNLPVQGLSVVRNTARVIIVTVMVLVTMELWGAPTGPLLLTIAILAIAAALLLRDAAPNLFAGFHLASSRQLEQGDYIRLEDGTEGSVISTGWSQTRLEGLDGSAMLVPNSRFVRQKVINYGHPLKRAERPFYFNVPLSASYVAHDLRQFVEALRRIPASTLHYHTFKSRSESGAKESDFCSWIAEEMGDEELASEIAAIDPHAYSLEELRSILIQTVEKRIK